MPSKHPFASCFATLVFSGLALAAASAPASAATFVTHCDRYGADCYRERCDSEGDNCVRQYDREDWRIRRSHYRHWYCDDDGCRYTYDIVLQHRYDDGD